METDTLLSLGNFKFSISTATYETLNKSHGWNWVGQPVIGADPALQFVGNETKSITIRGKMYHTFLGANYGTTPQEQIDNLIKDADAGLPLTLVTADGTILGYWVVVSLNLTDSFIMRSGNAQKVEFDLTIKRYSE